MNETPRAVTDTADNRPATVGHRWNREGSVLADLRVTLVELWHARDLLFQLAKRDVTIRYKQAIMGFGWALFMPLMTLVASVMVRVLVQTASGRPFVPESIVGIGAKALCWAFFVGALGFATPSLIANANLVTKIYFPREVLPLSAVLAQCFDTGIAAVALTLTLPWIGFHFSWAILWVPVLVALLLLLTTGLCLLLSCANLFFRDVKYLVQIFLTFGIFFTPVLFEPAMLGHRLGRWIWLNPLTSILEGLRLALAQGHNLAFPLPGPTPGSVAWSPEFLTYTAVWAVLGTIVSVLVFNRAAHAFAEYA